MLLLITSSQASSGPSTEHRAERRADRCEERRAHRRAERCADRRAERRADHRAEPRADRRAERRADRRAERPAERRIDNSSSYVLCTSHLPRVAALIVSCDRCDYAMRPPARGRAPAQDTSRARPAARQTNTSHNSIQQASSSACVSGLSWPGTVLKTPTREKRCHTNLSKH